MAASVKASKFNARAMANSTVPAKRIINGASTRADYGTRSLNSVVTILVKNGYLPTDSTGDETFSDMANLCLSGLSIVVETIEPGEPVKTFKETNQKPQNEADKKNNMQKKNYTDDTFPNEADPYYQMDSAPPDYIELKNEKINNNSVDTRAIFDLVTKIGALNSQMPSNFKLKQFVEDR